MRLLSPLSRQTLEPDSPHSLAAAGERWPVVDGIAYLRTRRDALVADALHELDEDRPLEALALLLGDQDDWARTPPPSLPERRDLVRDRDALTFRETMDRLGFAGVSTYFAHRWTDPTFLSGLALAEVHWPDRPPRVPPLVFELACGAGHFLRAFAAAGATIAGGDVVFAKLWLARHFLAPGATLVCFDAAAPWPLPDAAADILFCHDAFYFLPEKPHVAAEMHRVATGPLLVGHTHNRLVENLSAGAPLAPAELAALFEAPFLYDDAALTAAAASGIAPTPAAPEQLARAAAVSLASRAPPPRPPTGTLTVPAEGTALVRNPLYDEAGAVRWPSPRYEQEYAALATYPPRATGPLRAVAGPPDLVPLIRSRELVALPPRW